jgi:Ca-activated chloride channel family protein
MFEGFTLNAPLFLLLIPLFILLNTLRNQQSHAYYMPHTKYYLGKKSSLSLWMPLLKWSMVISSVFALSDPLTYKQSSISKNQAIDIVLALDTSGSMSLYGFNPKAYKQTRLEAVKKVVVPFIKQRTHDRIGLVIFGTHSAIASPLSFDKNAQITIVQNLQVGSLGKSTALVDAIVSSVKLLKESTSRSKVLILLSDGEDSSSTVPLPIALKLAKKYGVKIYTIVIDESHSDMMKHIAKASHTKIYNPKNDTALKEVYKKINALEKSQISYQKIMLPQHLYIYFLSFALLCGLLLLLLSKKEEIF